VKLWSGVCVTVAIKSIEAMKKIIASIAMVIAAATVNAQQPKYQETRYCSGDERSSTVVSAFRRIHPCPATGQTEGPCPGWAVDHVIPLAVGGCDAVFNLQWLPNEIKSCAGTVCKDRWERKIYKRPEAVN